MTGEPPPLIKGAGGGGGSEVDFHFLLFLIEGNASYQEILIKSKNIALIFIKVIKMRVLKKMEALCHLRNAPNPLFGQYLRLCLTDFHFFKTRRNVHLL